MEVRTDTYKTEIKVVVVVMVMIRWWEGRRMSSDMNLLFWVSNVSVKNPFFSLEDGTDWLSRNDGKELPLLAA